MTHAAITALRAEQQRALDLFATLQPAEWTAGSGCEGWRVQDVAQHMASVFHSIADPGTIEAGSSTDVEQNAEVPVRARRDWTPDEVMAEYVEWSERGIATLAAFQEAPLAETVIPLGNLGSHPMHILANAIVFDHYCHLRHDIGAALTRAASLPRDGDSLRATVEWMMTGVPQMCAEALATCTSGVNLHFTDLDVQYSLVQGVPLWSVASQADPALPTVTTTAHDFVSWGTKRTDWRDAGIAADGPVGQTLDAINVI